MYKQECFKIFTKKSIYLVFAVIVLLLVYVNQLPISMTMREDIFEELEETWGGPVTEEKVELAREAMYASDSGEVYTNTFEARATDYVQFLVVGSAMQKAEQHDRMNILEEQIALYNEGTYEYKEASKELEMLEEVGDVHGFYLIQSWLEMFEFIEPVTHVLILSIILLIGLTPVFSEEYSSQSLDLILATKHGKAKLVTAKILASITYIAIVFLSLHLINTILNLVKFGGAAGWNAPIQGISEGFDTHSLISYDSSPYSMDVWQFYLLSLVLQLLACIAVGMLVLFLSFLTKNTMITFFISGIIMAIPVLLQQLGITRGIFSYLIHFSYTELIKVSSMFTQFRAFNVFGYPVLYPTLIFILFAVITSLLIFVTYDLFRKQQVGN
ncbi:ABC-type transport system involved in multi-copper enzyme maturation permease subunit [Natronobacillus azotifigens]|uniref:ABC transporter permease n=1 Tax=Natronobacillus azotifigens TaxID=472978 RepID=A0A9J6REW3_9BACI|nr:hypothetical protein [Natronobacillus azotifigens]MCZ0703713.1 hypothetical protein [Natronobacillus azotifigens]